MAAPLLAPGYSRPTSELENLLTVSDSGISARFGSHTLSSHFQPIYGLSIQRPVGHEALLRSVSDDGTPFSPHALFGSLPSRARPKLDQLSHLLHLHNFLNMADRNTWLFLNMTPEVFLGTRKAPAGQSFGYQLEQLGFPAHQLVVEVLEEAVRDDAEFESAVAYFRELGCLIALDDFGAGSSNFDRIWKIRPQIVKLDRSIIARSANAPRIRRLLPQMVSMLHEAGAMVLAEGIETMDEAYIALDADIDFAQGYLFGRPHPVLTSRNEAQAVMGRVWNSFENNWQQERSQQKNMLAPYLNAIGYASVLLSAGRSQPEACASFLELPQADFCYLLDENGRQLGFNLWSKTSQPGADPRLSPLRDTRGARWARSPYFRRAIEHFGKPQVTRPYLSLSSARLCVTVSISFRIGDKVHVICGDIRCAD
ncbi:EAL domain, c-di-GMP-specific phosphodiesterase class I (or its enzymatically inactive variant) [Formivibrio citricus]|uniref:EAL domain, c-di-GMP-specific phosphodiesterase class I (Or its enzymatically inactive variant) n=1 Tax=Formivibrio citricus TaxID=83765 RepID=A0A1I4WDX7_9NEIS|nr:EAL domain-containing protein [Formivibrio citricus]SFN11563.1 EAL domain, c-di-GMP-specific phosphodiesterase class I (or its enzymatically inactive variant) [Formivibrio citricus]